MDLFLSRVHFPVTALGPGKRLGIWFQGCSIRCPGCISVDTWAIGRGRTELSAAIDAMAEWLAQANGVTISGGEPFDQADALHQLLREIRKLSPTDILVFTGYAREVLPKFATAHGLIDALVSDPYRADLPQRLALRGSDNQRLHLLTALGRERFGSFSRERTVEDDRLDVGFDDEGTTWLSGIPRRDALPKLLAMLHAAGHEARGTFDNRPPPQLAMKTSHAQATGDARKSDAPEIERAQPVGE
jgi:anaerobic ribonucleoside-triphosphate reductase activating protein